MSEYDDRGDWIGICGKCHTNHDGYPSNTFGGEIRCVRAQAVALGEDDLVEMIDRDIKRLADKRDEFLRDRGLIP